MKQKYKYREFDVYSYIHKVLNNIKEKSERGITICFSCKQPFRTYRITRHNFCDECIKLYFTRPSSTAIQGMDYAREIIRIRDNHTCQVSHGGCGRVWNPKERRFDIHHLDGVCGKKSRAYDKLDNMEKMSGLTTLCHKCHLNLPEVKNKMRERSSKRPLKDVIYQKKWCRENQDWLNKKRRAAFTISTGKLLLTH